jgi:hypothetical protein
MGQRDNSISIDNPLEHELYLQAGRFHFEQMRANLRNESRFVYYLLAVGDAKYSLQKPEDDKESHNQIFTYMIRWGTRHVELIFPASDSGEEGTVTYIIRNDEDERRLHFLKIGLQNMESSFASVQSFLTVIADTDV